METEKGTMLWTACGAPCEAIGKPLKGSAMGTRQIVVTERDCETLHKRIELLTGGVDEDSWSSVRRLHEELNHATILHGEPVPEDVVTMNSRVSFQELDTGEKSEITLVYPSDADVNRRRISILAPVGAALIGLRVGDEIEWPLPSGKTRTYKIISVLFQPEAEGRYDL